MRAFNGLHMGTYLAQFICVTSRRLCIHVCILHLYKVFIPLNINIPSLCNISMKVLGPQQCHVPGTTSMLTLGASREFQEHPVCRSRNTICHEKKRPFLSLLIPRIKLLLPFIALRSF